MRGNPKWIIIIIFLLYATIIGNLSNPTVTFAQSVTSPNYIRNINTDPNDSSLWITSQSSIIHLNKNGQILKEVKQRCNGFMIFFENLYCFTFVYDQITDNYTSISYQNYKTDITTQVTIPTGIPKCVLGSQTVPFDIIFNPINKQIYLNCSFDTIVDPTTNPIKSWVIEGSKLLASAPYTILGYNPVTKKLYALHYYLTNTPRNKTPYFDIITLDAKTSQPTNDPPIFTEEFRTTRISNFFVNSKTGTASLLYKQCYGKCGFNIGLTIDKDAKVTWGVNASVEHYTALNEYTNQLYATKVGDFETTVVDATNPQKTLAHFYWEFFAVDNINNLVYGVSRKPLDFGAGEDGQNIIVMDGTNYNVVRLISTRKATPKQQAAAQRVPILAPNTEGLYFPETGHTLKGAFLEYWQKNGGLAIFGYPITEALTENDPFYPRSNTVQYFERNRFEYHPENAGTPYEVQLALLGRYFSGLVAPYPFKGKPSEPDLIQDGVYFKETGHNLTGKFYKYWQENGGLAIFGFPITEPYYEVNLLDGHTYLIQYFERNRFELHPENIGSPYEVLLGQLGKQVLWMRGWDII